MPETRPSTPPATIELADWTARLAAGDRRSADDVRRLVEGVLAGSVDLDAFGRWLVVLADVGETSAEIGGVAAAIRGAMRPLSLPAAAHPRPPAIVADTCGTGGDGSGSFNISTAAAIVAAAAGQPVAKHGNRAVSSRTGSADVLEALGVRIDAPPDVAARCLAELGLCFCLAPAHHPAMARVGPLRRSLGRPTVFNLVGPLCNPAGATVQVIGVGRPSAQAPLAEAAAALGSRRTLVVSGHLSAEPPTAAAPRTDAGPRLDEVSLFGPTDVIDVNDLGPVGRRRTVWTPESFGLATLPPDRQADLVVDGPAESAAVIRGVLAGDRGPRRDVIVLNAAAVLYAVGGLARHAAGDDDLQTARERAEAAIDSGAAATLLAQLAARSQG
jgi:anthranilate phosphoribosyltransferase